MLNLQELEKRLDAALALETSESLSKWLLDLRTDNLDSFLGLGSMKKFKGSPYKFNLDIPKENNFICTNDENPSDQLDFAA